MADFHKELPAEGLKRVEIESWMGNVIVRTAAAGETPSLESGGDLEVTVEGGVLHAKQHGSIAKFIGKQLFGGQRLRIAVDDMVLYQKEWSRLKVGDIHVILPRSVRELVCSTGSGDITAEGVHAKIDAQSGKGNIRVEGAESQLIATTGMGNIISSQLSTDAVLTTGLGDVVATDINGARIEASTGKGEIVLNGSLAGVKAETGQGGIVCRIARALGRHELQTGDGDIFLEILEGIEARIDASTRHGRIESNLPLVKVGSSGPEGRFGRRLVGSVGSTAAQTTITIRTGRGDIKAFTIPGKRTSAGEAMPEAESEPIDILAAAAVADPISPKVEEETGLAAIDGDAVAAIDAKSPEAGQPVNYPAEASQVPAIQSFDTQARDTRLEILAALSRGEISVDEAAVLLRMEA